MLKELIPPLFLRYIIGFFYGWKGNYKTWKEAEAKCTGYDTDVIFSKVKEALLKVKNGQAVFERDSVVFDKVQYSFPLLSALSLVALDKGKLNVLDFGGSLGSSYYQNKTFFKHLKEFNWSIVEQKHFVAEGQKTFADEHLHFFYTIEESVKKHTADVALFASVLQYLENPYFFIDAVIAQNVEYIIIDRTPVFTNDDERITIQRVPKTIYDAQYPCWILNEKKLVNYISNKYDLVYDSASAERLNVNHATLKAYFFKRKK